MLNGMRQTQYVDSALATLSRVPPSIAEAKGAYERVLATLVASGHDPHGYWKPKTG